jgi:HTH-type transcriptional regulator / antitoxin HigA
MGESMGDHAMPHPYDPDYTTSPGETLAEVLAEKGMPQAELARRTGLSSKHVNQMISGTASITPDVALTLERVTGISARVWANLEADHQVHKSRKEETDALEQEAAWLNDFPVRELVKRGHVQFGRTQVEQLRELLGFFGVASPAAWESVWAVPTAYRKSRAFESNLASLSAWIRIGELTASTRETPAYDRSSFRTSLGTIRGLTTVHDPQRWLPALTEICSASGVIVVIEKELPRARINGIVRWVSDRPLIQLSLRHRWADIFWFTFFHEAAHLLLHDRRKLTFIDAGGNSTDLMEREADEFASRILIPRHHDQALSRVTKTVESIAILAREIGIDPGILVGRLQHDRLLQYSEFNHMRTRFQFTDPH